ncbi:MAG TPA: hypothetical protein VFT87_02050 [Candidatus Saccharimonadales bacterium]|nr:hypothetical protein [Candidatus Saccharimonadales bacterium]
MSLTPSSEHQTNPNLLRAAIGEVLFISGERQKAQRRVNAFFTKTPYSPELQQKIERDLPRNDVAPETCVEQRFAIFSDYGWMKNLDLGRVEHPYDWRGADSLQFTVTRLVNDFHKLGLAPHGLLDRSSPMAECRSTIARLSGNLSASGLFAVWRNRHLGAITLPGEEPIAIVKRSEFVLDATRMGIPDPHTVLDLPGYEGQSVEILNGLKSYTEGQIELQENGNRSLIPVRTGIFVYRDKPDLVLDGAGV